MPLCTGRDLADEEIARRYAAGRLVGTWPAGFYEKLIALAGNLRGARVLELGCGTGGLLRMIREKWGCELHGVDLVPDFAEEAGRALGPAAAIRVADMQGELPYPEGHFDAVFAMEVLEHLKRPERALAEARRVLRGDGRLVLSMPNATGYFPFHHLAGLLPPGWLKRKLVPYEHPDNTEQPIDAMYAYDEILDLMAGSGLAVEATAGHRYFRWATGFPLVRLAYAPFDSLLERLLDRWGLHRFAYHLMLRCRKAEPRP